MPLSTALVMPPSDLDLADERRGRRHQGLGEALDVIAAAQGVDDAGDALSSARMSWVFRAMRADCGVGKASASSKELVCSDCVPPSTAASASTVVRTTLL